ncbi:PIF1-like helicase domain-containing protein [Hirsutella rhossiliensis]|uniref:ATP-dependent DNA helicase n=1 Tax=Hirsutella rhossiliensis TaxID=111463 RepID=A0A9P8SFS9_9HYPO|nr:PIF1-like helicase domain-containing protein [Hirsutella rhossiliensis]KAH0960379.1 PIF1-like helicase domain-containing protein [Hirsutella rhossiliensis]
MANVLVKVLSGIPGGQTEAKRSRGVRIRPRPREVQAEDLADVLRGLEEEFEAGERLADERAWCAPVPREREVRTVQRFYRAFHDAGTLPIATCTLCYRKQARVELREMAWEGWSRSGAAQAGERTPFGCRSCFPEGTPVAVCAECARQVGRDGASAAMHLHRRLGCEHAYPDELKDLTPVEEKLIALSSCYGFVTKYSIPGGQRQSVRYPRHVKGHITVFPNDVQGLATKVLPHPLLRVMDEIHVSWQGAERPGPRDLSGLLSVRRRAVERALAWLKENNPLYGEVEIDTAEMDSWGEPAHGVPAAVLERLERDEPSARERTRTAHVVPPTERALDDEGAVGIEEVLAMLRQGRDPAEGRGDVALTREGEGSGENAEDARPEEDGDIINEVTSSSMFPLDGAPEVADTDKIRFAREAIGTNIGPRTWVKTATGAAAGSGGDGGDSEPYIQVRRGDEFADSADASFFAKAFPTLFPFGLGGPRLADEAGAGDGTAPSGAGSRGAEAERVAEGLTSTRNMRLRAWADIVLRRHGGRFATHPIFAFLVFNMSVRSRNRQASMLGMTRKNFPKVESLLKSLTAQRLEAARVELEATVKLRLAAHRGRDPDVAEAFLRDLGTAYKRTQLAISDPMSSAVFFHREMTLFFEHYVRTGEESVFGHVGAYYGAVETNERGALHVHGLLWLKGNRGLGEAIAGADRGEQAAYRERIVRYIDSVFSEELDAEAYCAVQAERSATADISSRLDDVARFMDTFDEEANFCAGATQVHTHSATCVKYSLGGGARKGDLCRFKAPWRLVERTALTADGVLEVRRTHSMVNRWNRAMAVGLRHNHDISFIATQRKTMALIYYITNYATKVEDPIWKRVAAAAELLPTLEPTAESDDTSTDRDAGQGTGSRDEVAADPVQENKTRVFLLKAANRVFTERSLSQVEVIAHLLGYPAEFSNGAAWAYINVNQLYWAVFRRWQHLRQVSGAGAMGDAPDETALRRPAKWAIVCLDGYVSKDFSEEDEDPYYQRAAVQHLALFVPWGTFLSEEAGDINGIWARARGLLTPRVGRLAENVQLLRRSAEDAKRDAKQWAATSEEGELTAARAEREGGEAAEDGEGAYRAGGAGDTARLIDVVRHAAAAGQVTAQSTELLAMARQLCRFQQSALGSAAELAATVVGEERVRRRVDLEGSELSGAALPRQEELRAVKSQQRSAAREREQAIQGIQGGRATVGAGADRDAALRGVMGGFGEDDLDVTAADGDLEAAPAARMRVRLGPSSSFVAAGQELAKELTLNEKQSIALLVVCRQLDRVRRAEVAGDDGDGQLCLFIGGEGGTGKSRVIEALMELLSRRDLSSQMLVTATSGTAAARINGITLHSACGLTVGQAGGLTRELDGVRLPGAGERFVDGRSRMDWREKEVLVVDEVSMLGARTLHAANERLCRLRGSARDFGGIPVVIFCGDFHQFRPVQERRRQHDKAHALWRRFTTVVMLDEQMRAAGDPELQRLLGRIRRGEQDRSDMELLNSRCHRPGRRIAWETGVTVVTPLNRNRWNLNLEAALAFRAQQRTAARVFLSEHKWKGGEPSEEEAVLMLGQGDDSATAVPAVFLFVPGMPVVVNQNTHQGLKVVNGAGYTAVAVIPDRAFPGHQVSAELTVHFGPPAGLVLASETTKDFHFVGMPAGTILLTPISVKITAQRKRSWQRNDVSRRGLPCAAAFACTDYKVQGGTIERVALELRGARTATVEGRAVASPCDPYSLYVQLSRCPTLDGITLVSEVRERDFIGNRVPEEMTAAQARLEELSGRTIREAGSLLRSQG